MADMLLRVLPTTRAQQGHGALSVGDETSPWEGRPRITGTFEDYDETAQPNSENANSGVVISRNLEMLTELWLSATL